MKKLIILFTLLIVLSISNHALAQFQMLKSVFGNGSTSIAETNFRLVGTIAQPLIGVTRTSSNIMDIGFWYDRTNTRPTSVQDIGMNELDFRLDQNYPNPLVIGSSQNMITTIGYTVPYHTHIKIELYNFLGNKIATIVDEESDPGTYKHTWNASGLTSGIYLYRLSGNGFSETKKITVLQ